MYLRSTKSWLKMACVFSIFSLAACSGSDKESNTSAASTEPAIAESTLSQQQPDTKSSLQALSAEGVEQLQALSSNLYTRPYDYPKTKTLPLKFVAMSTGKKLAVRVTLPADENGKAAAGPFPVILTQTAYNSGLLATVTLGMPGNLMAGAPDYMIVRRGYAQVTVDALGTGISEGGWELLGEEEQIGFADMVDWVHDQPWSNGKVGLAGVSYMAISSLFAAQRNPDKVDALFTSLPMGDAMRGIVGNGGLLNANFMSVWMQLTHMLSVENLPLMLLYPKHLFQIIESTKEHVAQIDSFHLPLIEDALWNEPYVTYDSDFWRMRSPLENIDKVKAPTFIVGGLDDLFQRAQPLLFERLKANGVDTRLAILDGFHTPNFLLSHIGNDQLAPINFLMLQWFDHYLKGMDTGIDAIPPVVQYVKNYPTQSTPEPYKTNGFSSTTDWPHPAAKAERWYLHTDNSLSQTAPETVERNRLMVNPEHPMGSAERGGTHLEFNLEINDGTICSRSYAQWVLGIVIPQNCHYNTNNSNQTRVVFDSEPMATDYYINGPIQADIWIESTVSEAVVSVQVEELSATQSKPITNGQLLASVRAVDESRPRFMDGEMIQPFHFFTQEKAQPLVPGEVVKMQIEIFPTSAIIRKGNRLRIALSPSNQAQGMLNFPRQELAAGGVTSIQFSPEYPSSVVVPVVPVSELN